MFYKSYPIEINEFYLSVTVSYLNKQVLILRQCFCSHNIRVMTSQYHAYTSDAQSLSILMRINLNPTKYERNAKHLSFFNDIVYIELILISLYKHSRTNQYWAISLKETMACPWQDLNLCG